MSRLTLPLALVLVSALLHAAWNALLKREADPRLAAVPVVLVAAILSMPIAAVTPGVAFPVPRAWIYSLVAGVFEGTYFYTLGRALALAPLGVVYTTSRGGALALVWPISIVFLREPLRATGAAGTALIALGLLATARDNDRTPVNPRGVVLALLCAASIAGYHLAYKVALSAGADPAGSVALSMSVGVGFNLITLDRERRAAVWTMLRRQPVLLAGALSALSFLLFLYALARGGAGAMLTLRNTSILFALIFSIWLGELPPRARWIGAI